MRRAARLLAAATVAATAGAFSLNPAGVANTNLASGGAGMRRAPATPNPLPAGIGNAASKPRHSASRAGASGPLYGSNAAPISGGERAYDERRPRVLAAGGAWTSKGSRPRQMAGGGSRGAGGGEVEVSAGGEVGVGVGAVAAAGRDKGRVWNKCTERVELGTSGLMVSRIGFGGIMIGGQMDEEQTHTVLNHAFDKAGINWLDTSESFPHPLIPEHKHKADPIVGSWLKGRDRSKVILCTKVAGRHEGVTWLRKDGTHPRLSRDHILESVYGSLERMDTDYIDMLYLGDWPDRLMVNPGEYYYKTSMEHELALDYEEQLMIVQELKDQGLVRHVAVANEGPYGVTRLCEHAIWDDLPKIACVQQEYNIFTQNKVEMDLVEACSPRQENVAIVATQTLGGGALSTKYMYERNLWDRKWEYRLNKFAGFQARYNSPRIREKITQYKNIAEKYGLTIHQLAMAFVHNKPFITASLMGATNVEQIDQNVGALDVILPEECLAEVVSVQDSYLEPMLGGSLVIPMRTYYEDKTKDYGHVDDESAKFWDRVTEDYTGP